MYIIQSTPLENGNNEGEGTVSWSEAGILPQNSKFSVEPTSQGSMYIMDIIPLENGDYESELTISWSGILPQKIKNSSETT